MSGHSNTVPLAEAKNKLSELIDRVSQGEEFTITRHDREIARLVPVKRPSLEESRRAVEAIKALRAARPVKVTTAEILAWKEAGRR
jgi:prevent-host-death family protein